MTEETKMLVRAILDDHERSVRGHNPDARIAALRMRNDKLEELGRVIDGQREMIAALREDVAGKQKEINRLRAINADYETQLLEHLRNDKEKQKRCGQAMAWAVSCPPGSEFDFTIHPNAEDAQEQAAQYEVEDWLSAVIPLYAGDKCLLEALAPFAETTRAIMEQHAATGQQVPNPSDLVSVAFMHFERAAIAMAKVKGHA